MNNLSDNKNEIKLIVFDMGHVFVDFEWDQVCKGFYERAGITEEQFKPVLKHIGSLGYENGHIDTATFLAALNQQTAQQGNNQPIGEDEFHTLWNATFRENLEMAALMQELRKQHRLFLLSNTNESHWNYLDKSFQVSRHFEELVLSYEIGHSKPNPEIYHEVIKRGNVAPEQCLFIDDLEPNIKAGAAVGMNVIHFQNVQDLHKQFKNYGIKYSAT